MEFDDADGITHPQFKYGTQIKKKFFLDKTPEPEVILVMPN
jgi:hypothetical protein